MLTLYFAPGSSSMAPHIALHEVGAPFDSRPLSFRQKQTREPAFLAINPEGKVPTLLIDGRPLTEVAASCSIWRGGFRRRDCCRWTTSRPRRRWCRGCRSSPPRCIRPGGRARTMPARVYAIADQRLGGREWAVGRYSIADIHLFRLFWRFRRSFDPGTRRVPAACSRTTADDGAAGGAADDRDRDRDRLRTAGVASERAAHGVDGGAHRYPTEPRAVFVLDPCDGRCV